MPLPTDGLLMELEHIIELLDQFVRLVELGSMHISKGSHVLLDFVLDLRLDRLEPIVGPWLPRDEAGRSPSAAPPRAYAA